MLNRRVNLDLMFSSSDPAHNALFWAGGYGCRIQSVGVLKLLEERDL